MITLRLYFTLAEGSTLIPLLHASVPAGRDDGPKRQLDLSLGGLPAGHDVFTL